ncbi:MAG TPA: hypothetical protein VHC95_10920 [Opitutales bacterium]|nr:hypothetical protein [Opitutales bacterium]
MLCLGLAAVLAGCGVKTTAFKSVDGRFSVQTPVPLQEASVPQDSDLGMLMMHTLTGRGRTHVFSIMYLDSPFNLEKLPLQAEYKALREHLVSNTQGTLISEQEISVSGHPGWDLVLRATPAGQKPERFRDVAVIVGHRLYQFSVEVPVGAANEAAINAFFQSIKIQPAPPPAAVTGPTSPEGGNFRVLAPVPLLATVKKENSQAGILTIHFFSGSEADASYITMYYDSPAAAGQDPAVYLKTFADHLVQSSHGEIKSDAILALGPYPGREVIFTYPELGTTFVSHSRLYLAGNRLYELKITTFGKSNLPPEAEGYFKSFIITAPTNLPATAAPTPLSAAAEGTPVAFWSGPGGFSVMTPAPMNTTNTNTIYTNNHLSTSHEFLGVAGHRQYAVGYTDSDNYDENSNYAQQLAQFGSDLGKKLGGEAKMQQSVTVMGHPGAEFLITGPNTVTKARIYLVGQRSYHVLVTAPKGEENPPAAEAFLDSFSLLAGESAK